MKLDSFKKLYIHELNDLYDAEKQLVEALPKMVKAATSSELRVAFENHLDETNAQVDRLETALANVGEKPKRVTCKGMKGLIEEGEEMIKQQADTAIRDAGLIAAAQRIEHYEIAGYGCARTYAEMLGEEEAGELLQQSLDEERTADESLTALAESLINVEAAQA